MILFPAIDLKNGECVRLLRGDMARATVFNIDPPAQARAFADQGFEYLHVVDLDGAFAGKPVNAEAVKRILSEVTMEVQLGGATFERVRGTLLGTMLRMANGAGVTPWTLLPQLQRFWNRAYDGAGIQVVRLGLKDAQVDLIQCPFADTHYHRNALRGVVRQLLRLFCRQAYVQEPKGHRAPGSVSLRAQWV